MNIPSPVETDFVLVATWLDDEDFPYTPDECALIHRTVRKGFSLEAVPEQDKYELRCLYFQVIGARRLGKQIKARLSVCGPNEF